MSIMSDDNRQTEQVSRFFNRLIPVIGLLCISILISATVWKRLGGKNNLLHQHKSTWRKRLNKPIPALPVDIFRILVGLLSFSYFRWLYTHAEDFDGPNGLIDHQLTRRIFWYTKLNLLFPGLPLSFFKGLYASAMGLALFLATGFWPRLTAALLFIISVTAYRWHFIVMNVEDSVMHLVLFWTALMPIGKTLTIPGWMQLKTKAATQWRQQLVPGAVIRTFLGNVALIYLVAGLWKWTSTLWRQGLALYASFKTPVSRWPTFWDRRHLPLLIAGNHFSLVIEPILPLMIILPDDNPLKWVLAGCAAAFNIGIALTLHVPYANVALVAALTLVMREKLALFLGARSSQETEPILDTLDRPGSIGLGLLTLLTLAMLWEVRHPEWRVSGFRSEGILYRVAERLRLNPNYGHHQNPFFALLWILGFAQSYRLVDWIDERNYFVTYNAIETYRNGVVRTLDPDDILPQNLRGAMVKTYLHGVPWLKVKPNDLAAIREMLFERIASRYCLRFPDTYQVTVYTNIQRVNGDNLDFDQAKRHVLFRFENSNGQARILETAEPKEMTID